MIDSELNDLAVLVIKNALYRKLESVMSAHFAAAKGLDFSDAEFYEVHAFPVDGAHWGDRLDIWTGFNSEGSLFGPVTTGYDTILEALNDDRAQELHVEGRKVFERRDGEWFYVEEV